MASGVPLIVAALSAPLVGVRKRDPHVHHALDMGEVTKVWLDGKTGVAACGTRHIRVLVYGQDGLPVLWPERVDSLPPGWSRCRACHQATGRQAPRSKYVQRHIDGDEHG